MPQSFGGSPYKRAQSSLRTAAVGPGAITDDVQAGEGSDGDILGQCEVSALDIWYWAEDGSFVPETMYINLKDTAHAAGEPRLVVSLSSFQALSQAYAHVVEKESIKSNLLHEKEALLRTCRIGYYKELEHLREMLEMARQHMVTSSKGGYMDEYTSKRLQRFAQMVRETEVHYFDIVETLDPDLKALLKEAVKQFNRDVMRENFELKDRLALHEGADGDDALAERMITLLLSKGLSPLKIVKTVAGMINDKKQSDEFYEGLKEMLGISGVDLSDLKSSHGRTRGGGTGEADTGSALGASAVGGPSRASGIDGGDDSSFGGRTRGRGGGDDGAGASQDAAGMEAELMKLRKQLEAQKRLLEQQKTDMEAKLKTMEQQMREAQAKAAQMMKERDAALSRSREGGGGSGQDDAGPSHGGGGFQGARDSSGGVEPGGVRMKASGGGGGVMSFDAEEADRIRRELEKKLRDAMAKIEQLSKEGGGGGGLSTTGRPETAQTADETPTGGSQRQGMGSSGGMGLGGFSGDESGGLGKTKRFANTIKGGKMELLDRNFDEFRHGDYSAMTGRPIAMVEAELDAERKRRIGLEQEKMKILKELSGLQESNRTLEEDLQLNQQLVADQKSKLESILSQDELDGIDDAAIFCRWLIKKYGSLDRGFRALDSDANGLMSLTEFTRGLTQMGWVQIVGRRLYKVIDSKNKGQITLEMLYEVYRKYVEGRAEDPELARRMEMMMKEQEKENKEERSLEIAKDRIKKQEEEKALLEEELSILRKKVVRLSNQPPPASKDNDAARKMERKADALKSGYDQLKTERDELASKMTAAMWKCREAYILQVKYKREAETKTEEMNKLTKKFDLYKAHFKSRGNVVDDLSAMGTLPSGGDPLAARTLPAAALQKASRSLSPSGFGGGQGGFAATVAAGSGLAAGLTSANFSLSLVSPTRRGGADSLPTQEAEQTADDTDGGAPGSADVGSLGSIGERSHSSAALATSVLGAALVDAGGDHSEPLTPPRRRLVGTPTSPGVASFTCPQCNAVLALTPVQEELGSASDGARLAGTLRPDSLGGLSDVPEPIKEDAQLSPEELIGKMSDEELLGGLQGSLGSMGRTGMEGFGGGFASTMGAGGAEGKLLPYRARMAARLEAGFRPRHELLFLDSVDRQRFLGAMQSELHVSTGGYANPVSATTALLSQESKDLIEHARKIRLLWREAVPIDEVLPHDVRHAATLADGEERGRGRHPSPKDLLLSSGAVTVGRTVQKQKQPAPFEGTLPLDEAYLQQLQSQVEDSAGKQAGAAFAAAARSTGQLVATGKLTKKTLTPFEGRSGGGAAALGTGLPLPSLIEGTSTGTPLPLGTTGESLRIMDKKAQVLEDYSKKIRERSNSPPGGPPPPERGISAPLCIVGANAPHDLRTGSPATYGPAGVVYADSAFPNASEGRPRPRTLDHLGGTGSMGHIGGTAGVGSEENLVHSPYDLEEGGQPAKWMSKGHKDVRGTWRSAHPGAHHGVRGGNVDTPGAITTPPMSTVAAAEIGAGLPPAATNSLGSTASGGSPVKPRPGTTSRRTPQHLPQLSPTPDMRRQPQRQHASLRHSASMPDFAVDASNTNALARQAKVQTPPLAATAVVASPDKARRRGLPQEREAPVPSIADKTTSFEASSHRAGTAVLGPSPPPSRSLGGHSNLGASCRSPGLGGSFSRQQLMMATGAFELSSRVERHAAAELGAAPLVIQGGGAGLQNTAGKVLLA